MYIVTYDDTPCFLFLETVRTVSLLATVCDTLSAAYRLLFSAGLSECRFFCSCPHPRRRCFARSPKKEVIAKSYPIQPVIQL